MLLSVIIPAYNEENNLQKSVNKYNKYLKNQHYDYEIIIVNDGSQDNTEKCAEKLKTEIENVCFVNNLKNKGKGHAVRTGMIKASGDYCLFIDADNATSINHLDKAREFIESGSDIIIGTRSAKDAVGAKQAKPQSLWKRKLGKIGNTAIQFLVVKGVNDTQCGFKIFSRKAVDVIFPQAAINRWGFDIELLTIGKINNLKIEKIGVEWFNSNESRVGLRGYFIALKELIKIKWNVLTGKYVKFKK